MTKLVEWFLALPGYQQAILIFWVGFSISSIGTSNITINTNNPQAK